MKSPLIRTSTVVIALSLSLVGGVICAEQATRSAPVTDPYALGPDSKPRPGVPRGKIFEFTFGQSKIFPGTTRKITVYVPAQYRADKPACVYVGLDALGFEAPAVFDNLIHKGEMPVTIGIGVSSGTVDSARPPVNPRFNRSFEFDGLNDNLARFLLEELFPEVERRKTPDGLPILLSQDPNDRAAGGASTGGIGSFTLAWERPDAFRRVFTAIGTFVGMRGGDRYPVLIRKTEPKPIRIFMQDGSLDGLPGFLDEVGDWWMGNQTMQRALQFAGYPVEHRWGDGGHDGKHATAIFPEAMRWLWQDWPKPVTAGESQNTFLRAMLLPNEGWAPLAEGEHRDGHPVEHPARKLLVDARRYRIKVTEGSEYWTDFDAGTVWLKRSDGQKVLLDTGLQTPTGIARSPDGLWLAVAQGTSHWGYTYQVQPDGTVRHKQKFYWFHVADEDDISGAGNWVFDREGRLYAATRLGIQVFDRNGRVRAIMPVPGKRAVAVSFGGEDPDVLYVESADRTVYRRKLKVSGISAGSPSIELPAGVAG